MKRIFYIIGIFLFVTACTKDNFLIDEAYEKAEITGVEFYNKLNVRADKSSVIKSGVDSIYVTLKPGQLITELKLAVSASTGAEILPRMSVGYQDFTEPKTYEITSPNKTVKKTWVIRVLP